MKPCLAVLLAGVMATAFSGATLAMPAAAPVAKVPSAYPMDCARWKDPSRCAALNRNIEACRDKTDDAWRECMGREAPAAKFTPPRPRDCSKARNQALCEAHARALEACKDARTRTEHRACMAGQAPATGKN